MFRRLAVLAPLVAGGLLLVPGPSSGRFSEIEGPSATCVTDFDCISPSEPICEAGTCVAGPAACVGDDTGETSGDDGPAGARDLTGSTGVPVALAGAVCNVSSREADHYKVTVSAGQGLELHLSWSGDANLDLAAYDDTGAPVGLARFGSPETITLTILPAGTFYVAVRRIGSAADTTPVAYSLSATRTTASLCVTDADCADEFATQLFRSECVSGACEFRAGSGQAALTACDDDGDCASGLCSHVAFESDAADAICTIACATDIDCAGLGAGLACSSGLQPDRCLPTCAGDIECGADLRSSSPDVGQRWDYFRCDPGPGRCFYSIFVEGHEIGDFCSWSGSAPESSCP